MLVRQLLSRNDGLLGDCEGLLQVLRQARPVPRLLALPEGRRRGLVHLDVLDRGALERGTLAGAAEVGVGHHEVVQGLMRFLCHDFCKKVFENISMSLACFCLPFFDQQHFYFSIALSVESLVTGLVLIYVWIQLFCPALVYNQFKNAQFTRASI